MKRSSFSLLNPSSNSGLNPGSNPNSPKPMASPTHINSNAVSPAGRPIKRVKKMHNFVGVEEDAAANQVDAMAAGFANAKLSSESDQNLSR